MTTIKELFYKHGPGVKVDIEYFSHNPYILHAVTKSGRVLVEDCGGCADSYHPDTEATLHVEPKPKMEKLDYFTIKDEETVLLTFNKIIDHINELRKALKE